MTLTRTALVLTLALAAPALADDATDPTKSEDYLRIMPAYDGDEEPWENVTYEKYTSCERLPMPDLFSDPLKKRNGRDLYGYYMVLNVLKTKDCSCSGKVIPWDKAVAKYKELRKLTPSQKRVITQSFYEESDVLETKAEFLCGGQPF